MNNDIYPAVCVAAVGRYGGVVRDIHKGALVYCEHVHKKRSTALLCAEKLMTELIER